MFKSRGRGRNGRGRGNHGSNTTKVPLKGLFSDGIWKCNCDPRLPAQHFQTKNGGKNHGRWFYTCQLPQTKRCDFFLWDDEAKGREAAAVLNNSRTEPSAAPTTPSKPPLATGLATPQTGSRFKFGTPGVHTPYTPPSMVSAIAANNSGDTQATAATTTSGSDEEFYDWPASDDEELAKAVEKASSNQPPPAYQKNMPPPPETPRKVAKTDTLTTPGKRRYDDLAAEETGSYPTPASALNGDDVFATSSTITKSGKGNLFTFHPLNPSIPSDTPTPIRYKDVPSSGDTELATDILTTLAAHTIALPADAREAVKSVCNKHVLYTRGIMKGRDVSRGVVKTREEKMVGMQAEIEGLKSERETNRAVIRHLRREVAQRKDGGG